MLTENDRDPCIQNCMGFMPSVNLINLLKPVMFRTTLLVLNISCFLSRVMQCSTCVFAIWFDHVNNIPYLGGIIKLIPFPKLRQVCGTVKERKNS